MLVRRNNLARGARCRFRLTRYLPEASPGVLKSAKFSREDSLRTLVVRVTGSGPVLASRCPWGMDREGCSRCELEQGSLVKIRRERAHKGARAAPSRLAKERSSQEKNRDKESRDGDGKQH